MNQKIWIAICCFIIMSISAFAAEPGTVELCDDDLYLGYNLSSCQDAITSASFVTANNAFSDRLIIDRFGSTVNVVVAEQELAFDSQMTGQFTFTQDDDDAPFAKPYLFIDNSNNFFYTYTLNIPDGLEYDVTSRETAELDLVGVTLYFLDERYVIKDIVFDETRVTSITVEALADGRELVLDEINGEIIEDGVDIDGSLVEIDAEAGILSSISISYAPDTDEIYVSVGETFLDPVFGFEINFKAIENSDKEEIEFVAGSTSALITFYNNDGTYVELPLAADSSYTSGESATEPIFWGNEAPSSTSSNIDELMYLENEVCLGSTSVIDCQGAMFLVIENGNAHLMQITNIDTNDNEINFDDLTYSVTDDDLIYTDATRTTFSLTSAGSVALLINEGGRYINFTTTGAYNGANITTLHQGTLTLKDKPGSLGGRYSGTIGSQTFQGLLFSEYNDGSLASNKYLGYGSLGPLNITASYDDATDNAIEWNSTGFSALSSTQGFGPFDKSDRNDDEQLFMTKKGTLVTYDREDQSYLTIAHPEEAVHAKLWMIFR